MGNEQPNRLLDSSSNSPLMSSHATPTVYMTASDHESSGESNELVRISRALVEMGYTEEQVQGALSVSSNLEDAIDYLLDSSAYVSISDTCPICQGSFAGLSRRAVPRCFHVFCSDCFQQYLTVKIEDSEVLSIMCPMADCESELTDSFICSLVPQNIQEKYYRFKRQDELSTNPNLRWCPVADCSGYDVGGVRKYKLQCNVCSYSYCYYCGGEWKDRHKCNERNDLQFDKWAKGKGVKFCPNCKRRVEKLAGCDHMTCPKCKYEWCWLCGDVYYAGHFDICDYKNMQKKNPPWGFVLLCLFAGLILPFFVCILGVVLVQRTEEDPNISPKWLRGFLMKKLVSIPVVLVVCLIITPVVFAATPFITGIILVHETFMNLENYYSYNAFGMMLLEILLGTLATPLLLLSAVLALVITHIIGLIYLVIKLKIMIVRCTNPSYMNPRSYAQY